LPFITAIPDFTLLSLEVVFIFCFQIFFGYIYHYIALLMASIMAGIALGNCLAQKKISAKGAAPAGGQACLPDRQEKKRKIKIKDLEIIYLLLAMLCFLTFLFLKTTLLWLFTPFLTGFLVGLEFPFTNALLLQKQKNKEQKQKTGLIYGVDLIGSAMGAILTPLFLIPFFGLNTTLFFLIGINLLGFFWLKLIKKR